MMRREAGRRFQECGGGVCTRAVAGGVEGGEVTKSWRDFTHTKPTRLAAMSNMAVSESRE